MAISNPQSFASAIAVASGEADHLHPFPIIIACKECGGTDVSRDAAAGWDHETQTWVLKSVQDEGTCERCGGSVTLNERKTDAEGNDRGPIDDFNMTNAEEVAKWGPNEGDRRRGFLAAIKSIRGE